MFARLLNRWRRQPPKGDVYVDEKGRQFEGPRALYDMLTADYPTEAPFGAESGAWLAAVLGTFNAERLQDAAELARSKSVDELREPKALRDWLGSIWDAVSRELDCTDLPEAAEDQLKRLEAHLAHSVYVLRPVVGY